jgi:hypothetical protein
MRRGGTRNRLGLTALLAMLVVGLSFATAGPALGYYTTSGSGSGSKVVGSLTVPTISAATPAAGGTVALTWAKGSTPTGVAYYVTRNGGAPDGTCPTQAEPENDISTCTDSGLEPGVYTYKVFAKYRTFSATSAAVEAKITVGPADHFLLAVASTTPSAGAADNLTITAKDKAGSTVTTYTGSKNITFAGAQVIGTNKPTVANSSGTATAFGTATALTFTAGVAAVTSTKNGVMKLYKAETATLSCTDGAIESEVGPVVTVSPLAMSKLVLGAATTTPVAGAEDALTTTAQDTYGNLAPTYTGLHSLVYSGASASANGNTPTVSDSSGNDVAFGTATPTNFTAGVATVSGETNGQMVLYKAAAASIKVTEGSVASATITVTATPATAASLKVAAASTTPAAGATDNLTTTALDTYGNTATGYTGSKNITFSGPEPSPSGTAASVVNSAGTTVNIGSATALTFTAGVAAAASSKNGVFKAAKSGAATLSATDGTISTASVVALTVSAGTAARYAWSAPTVSAGTKGSPCLFTCAVTGLGNSGTFTAKVAVTDSLGNVVSNLGTANSVAITATGTTGSIVTGSPLTIATTGLAESTATFTYTAPSGTGAYSNTITAAKSSGTAYTSATATTTK